jgi:pimeloyl-ACP methyl ester carboxylesterase
MRILVMTGEQLWPPSARGFLGDVFRLTPAEIDLLRHLVSGSTVQSIARGSGRRAGTIRSQIHSILEKTGAEGQAELVRLVTLILQTAALGGEASTSDLLSEPRHRFLRLSDGRRMEVLMLGAPEGVPVLWLHTFHGYFRLPREAERDFARRNLRVIIPVRAGWAGSDAPPAGRDVLELAVADATELMTALGIDSATVIAPSDDIRIALMLARAAPGAVRHIVGLSCGFPILDDAQFRRLMPVSRFVRACAQYEPRVLPIAAKAFRITMLRYGIERYLRGMVAGSPADSRALADPAIATAVVAGVHYMYAYDVRVESAFCAEMRAFTRPWPHDLGDVQCPVTLVHGAHDLNAPLETARDYCARYPRWRLIVFPDEGQYVGLVRWPELLDLVARRALPEQTPLPAPVPLDAATSPWRYG